jgi:hypothetical protein
MLHCLFRWNVILELNRYLFDPFAGDIKIQPKHSKSSGSVADSGPTPTEEKDIALKKRLQAYLDGRTPLTEIFWNESDVTETELLAFAERNAISVLYHYCRITP